MFLPPQFCRNKLLLDNSVLYNILWNVHLIQKIKEITAINGDMAPQVKARAAQALTSVQAHSGRRELTSSHIPWHTHPPQK